MLRESFPLILSVLLLSASLEVHDRQQQAPEARAVWFNTYAESFVDLSEAEFEAKVRDYMGRLSLAGFNTVFYLVKTPWDAKAHYASNTMERITYDYDPLKIVIEEGRSAGLEVHAYFNVLAEGDSAMAGRLVTNRDWALRTREGFAMGWLNPFEPGVKDYVLEIIGELVRYEGLSGIQLDRVRFPGNNVGYNEGILQLYRDATGKTPSNDADPDWVKFRAGGVTSLVKAISEEVRRLNPNLAISAAVFPDKYSAFANVLQDWETWAGMGYVDFLATMSYTDSVSRLESYIRGQVQAVNFTIPLYVGISAETATDTLFMDEVSSILGSPANGFVVFNANLLLESPGKMESLQRNLGSPAPPTPHSSQSAWEASREQSIARWKEFSKSIDVFSLAVFGGLALGVLALLLLAQRSRKRSRLR